MKLTNAEVYRTKEPLTQLMNSEKFHVKVCIDIVKLAQLLESQIKQIDQVKDKLIKDHGKPTKDGRFACNMMLPMLDDAGNEVLDEKGNPKYESNPEYPKFADAMDAMFDTEVELDFEPVKIPAKVVTACPKCHHNFDKELQLAPAMMMSLDKFLVFT